MTYIIYLFIILFEVLLDQFSKQIVTAYLDLYQKVEVIPSFFNLTYVQNYGAGFSILEGQRFLFLLITIVAIIIFSYMLYKGKNSHIVYKTSLLLILGGTLGNFIDRIIYEGVVDFIGFKFGSYQFPIFNIADIAIVVGVLLILLEIIRGEIYEYRNKQRKH